MSHIDEHIAPELLLAYITQDISTADASIIEAWIQSKPEHAEYIEQCKQVWEQSGILLPKPVDVDVAQAWKHMSSRIDSFEAQKQKGKVQKLNLRMLFRIAAIVIIPLVIISIYVILNPRSEMQQIAAKNTSIHDTLTDGSTIALAPDSKIEVSDFEAPTREITMQGEVFFTVTKNPEKPFLVKTENTIIKVVGTKFNVISRANKPEIEVIVESGKVLFFAVHHTDTALVTLEAGDKGIYNKQTQKLLKLKPEKGVDLFWHNKTLLFQKTKIIDIIHLLEKNYSVNITIASKELENMRFTSTFENQPIDTILWIMGTTLDFTCIKQDSTYVLQANE
ncbi:MAG: fec operon regulator FecR [Bacteroidetes bacterium ADurb.Bin217]|nr:MAG: fec operon regulator FecR [Bacteroidetes bacterium ADurb.Bin217]HOS84617.1 FecR family protein [Bacteroidales bacterium]